MEQDDGNDRRFNFNLIQVEDGRWRRIAAIFSQRQNFQTTIKKNGLPSESNIQTAGGNCIAVKPFKAVKPTIHSKLTKPPIAIYVHHPGRGPQAGGAQPPEPASPAPGSPRSGHAPGAPANGERWWAGDAIQGPMRAGRRDGVPPAWPGAPPPYSRLHAYKTWMAAANFVTYH